jgi:hypothetical protein
VRLVLRPLREEDPIPTANDHAIVDRVGGAKPRRDVVLVARLRTGKERREAQLLADVILIVVPDAEIQGQA